jgi:hypothetical protein
MPAQYFPIFSLLLIIGLSSMELLKYLYPSVKSVKSEGKAGIECMRN